MLDRLPRPALQRWYAIFALTDETYSVLTTLPENIDRRRLVAIAALEAKYRDQTGISALKIRHNGVLGYFVEVPARHADALMAPGSDFTHRQTMAGAVRFNAVALHEEATRIAQAGGHALAAEEAHFEDLIARAARYAADNQNRLFAAASGSKP